VTDDPVYVLDANVFIQAARRYYAFDLAPAFWRALVHHASEGRMQSIDRVLRELERGKDELSQWAKSSFHQWFASTAENDVIEAYRKIMAWVQGQSQFSDAAKAEFANGADGWLIAYAQAKGRVVVTHEQRDPGIKRKIPIPNVCEAFGDVPFIDTFEMLRAMGVRLG
jgi:hypothetical protein